MHGHRHPLTRRQALGLLGGAAVAAPFVGGIGSAAAAEDRRPKPIPGGIVVGGVGFHISGNDHQTAGDPSTPVLECSTITDFDGVLASWHHQGTGTGHDLTTGQEIPLAFDTDMRFMQGRYIAEDGNTYEDTFGFV